MGASTSMMSITVPIAAVHGSQPSASAETTNPSTAQISSIRTTRPERSIASATASARWRRLRHMVSRSAVSRVHAMFALVPRDQLLDESLIGQIAH